MIKEYTDKQYSNMALQANEQHKKLIKVQEEIEVPYEVYEYEKKTIQVPIYNDEGEIIGYEDKEVDDLTKPIMIEEIDPETGETILVHKHHTEYKTEIVERLEIIDNPENFERCFFKTSLGFVKREVTMADGSHKDFISDMVAGLKAGTPILTYDRELNQYQKFVTNEFIAECIEQAKKDFYNKNANTTDTTE